MSLPDLRVNRTFSHRPINSAGNPTLLELNQLLVAAGENNRLL